MIPPHGSPCLSLRQPWTYAVTHLAKPLENRHWWTSHRGPFWIHAGKAMTKREYQEACDFMLNIGVKPPERDLLQFGGIVGYATLKGVLRPAETRAGQTDLEAFRSQVKSAGEMLCWRMDGQHAFYLIGVGRLSKLIPFKGSLGFFRLPPDVERAAIEAAAA